MAGHFLSSLINLWRDWQTPIALTNVQTQPTDSLEKKEEKKMMLKKLTLNGLVSLNHHKTLTSHLHLLYSSLTDPLYWFCASTYPAHCRDMCVKFSLTKPSGTRPTIRSTVFVCVDAAAILEEEHTHTHTYAQPGLLRVRLTEQRLYLHFTDWQIRII